ncbi:MAG: DUF2059 domain-containing protein [Chthoniobacter sp.]|uniref:DUF2059 domain-containing protein n=1 Tax=Chthoniobacter sp. TaxID=2510640 RepID=UPI0032AAF1E0
MKGDTATLTLIRVLFIAIFGFSHCAAQDASGERKALADELISLMRLETSFKLVLEQKGKMEESADSSLSPEQKATRRRQADKIYNWDAIKPIWMQIYTEIFTDEDLRGMIVFFKSPVGQKWLDTQPEVQTKTMQKMQAYMRDAERKLRNDP